MRTLVLSCNTGQGHNSCAQAVKEYYDIAGEQCDVVDALSFVSPAFSKITSLSHDFIYKNTPALFGVMYSHAEKDKGFLGSRGLSSSILALGVDKLSEFVCKNEYDSVICTHVFSAYMLGVARSKGKLRSVCCHVSTDYTCSPGTEKSGLDWYFVPHEQLREEFVLRGIENSRIIVSGIPVKRRFYQKTDGRAVKRALGIDENAKHMLIMCGSMGCGQVEGLVRYLVKNNAENSFFTVICGKNRTLLRKLQAIKSKNLFPLGFVSTVDKLMDGADLFFTKPGGLSVTEAAVKGVPMVCQNAVSGCEQYNMSFFVANGGAKVATPKTAEKTCRELLSSPKELAKLAASISRLATINSAEIIYKTLAKAKLDML